MLGTCMAFPPKIFTVHANWYQSRQAQPIKCIVAHDTERQSDQSDSIAYLQRGGSKHDGSDRKVSIHVLIEPNGDQYEMVPDQLAANHAGFGTLWLNGIKYDQFGRYSVNTISLGFELEYTKSQNKPYPDQQMLSMGYWIASKRAKYGRLPIFTHAFLDPDRRSDPRNLSLEAIERWVLHAQMLMNDHPTPANPLPYRTIVPQVVYQSRSLGSNFAGDPANPLVLEDNKVYAIGDITGDWAWLANGWGFVPLRTLVKV